MALLSPSIVRLERPLDQCIQIINRLGCKSVHVDVCRDFSLPNFLMLPDIQSGVLRELHACVTLHLFQLFDGKKISFDFLKERDLVVLHVFPHVTQKMIVGFLTEASTVRCKVGLAIDLKTSPKVILANLEKLDTVFVMGIPVATHGLQPDAITMSRLADVASMIRENNARCRLGLDGGVNITTFTKLASYVDELVIGSLLFDAPDIAMQWRLLQSY